MTKLSKYFGFFFLFIRERLHNTESDTRHKTYDYYNAEM